MAKKVTIYINDEREKIIDYMIEDINHMRRVEAETINSKRALGKISYKSATVNDVINQLIDKGHRDMREQLSYDLELVTARQNLLIDRLKIMNRREHDESRAQTEKTIKED